MTSIHILESQYYTPSCAAPPDIMYSFYVSDLYTSAANETWSPTYKLVVQEYFIGSCGYNSVLTSNCCYELLDIKLSSGFYSAMPAIVQNSIFESMPLAARNIPYCTLEAETQTSLSGYRYIFIRANGKCIAGKYVCHPTALSVFADDSNCIGNNYTSSIYTYKTATINNPLLSSNYIWLVSNNLASQTFSWIAYTPSIYLQLTNGMLGAYSFMAYGASFAISGYLVLESSITCLKCKSGTHTLVTLFSSVNWMLYIIFKFVYLIARFPTIYAQAVQLEFTQIFQNFATFSAIYSPYKMLTAVLDIEKSTRWVILGLLIVFHLIFAGGNYIYYLTQVPNQFEVQISYSTKLFIVYVVFLFIWNILPQVYISGKFMFQKKNIKLTSKLQQIHHLDPKFFYYVILDIVIFVLYVALYYFMNFTELLKNDYVYQSMFGYQDLLFLAHNLISIQVARFVRTAFTEGKRTANERNN